MAFRLGIRLGLDWGKARIGVAACDREGILCYPLETVSAYGDPYPRIRQLVSEYEPLEVVLGLPVTLSGEDGLAVEQLREVAARLSQELPETPLRLVDERLSTAYAAKLLRQAEIKTRGQRRIIDQAAAVAILEQAVSYERSTGETPGVRFAKG